MSDTKLRCCTLCGGKAMFYSINDLSKGEFIRLYGITCKNTYCCRIPPEHYTQEKAIEKWNTRKPIERIVEKLEERCDEVLLSNEMNDYCYGSGMCEAINIVKGDDENE